MQIFEWTLALLVVATISTGLARRFGVPYPSMLALLGMGLVFVPSAPHFVLEPELALALFVAPVLLDSAFDTSLRDLKKNWRPIMALVFSAVGGTVLAVALVAKALMPAMPWPAAVALGAIVAPPDAAAASAVLKQAALPHRLMQILEGESLLNDASALLIYRIAAAAAMAGTGFHFGDFGMLMAWTLAGSVVLAIGIAWLSSKIVFRVEDVPTSVVLQFSMTFAVWLLAERLHLSGILTVVVYAMIISRPGGASLPARIRVPSYAVWETVVFVLNALAFVLIGLQLGPILDRLPADHRDDYALFAGAVLLTTVLFRVLWVYTYDALRRHQLRRLKLPPDYADLKEAHKSSLVTAWCGMRGIVTLAAALALPKEFPQRDLIVLTAFTVVLGTLLIQGLTLKPLLRRLKLKDDGLVEHELGLARKETRRAVLEGLGDDQSPASRVLRFEYGELEARDETHASTMSDARRASVKRAREALDALRKDGRIGDQAYQQLEAELDRAELFADANL